MPFSRSLPALALRSLARLGLGALLVLAACGSEIGDACQLASDCDPDGDRVCLRSTVDGQPDVGGYCTVVGCDPDTCPDEAVCVRFYAGAFQNKDCDPATEDTDDPTTPDVIEGTDACSLDEACSVQKKCALRASEVRYCMLSCGSSSDCRSGYECRDRAAMEARGGEPVLPDGERIGTDPARFCAVGL